MTWKANRKVATKKVIIGDALNDPGSGDRWVYRETVEREAVNPPLSATATEQIKRLEVASARTRQRLGHIRMN